MSKGKKILLLFGTFLILIAVVGVLLSSSMEKDSVVLNAPVEIVNGESTQDYYQIPIEISKAGKFFFDVEFWPEEDPGFITGLVILGPDGEVDNAVTGNKLMWNGPDKELKKGTYTFKFYILENDEEYIKFVRTYIPNAGEIECNFEGYSDGNWDMEYAVSLERSQKGSFIAIVFICVLFGVLLGLMTISLFISDEKTKPYYDERQQIARYKSGFCGFITIISLVVLWGLLEVAQISIPAQPAAICFTIAIIGLMVMVSVGIWDDGYFGMNTKKEGLRIFFAVLGIFQLALGIIAAFRGALVENGILSFRVITIEWGIVLTFLTVLSFIKDHKDVGECEE